MMPKKTSQHLGENIWYKNRSGFDIQTFHFRGFSTKNGTKPTEVKHSTWINCGDLFSKGSSSSWRFLIWCCCQVHGTVLQFFVWLLLGDIKYHETSWNIQIWWYIKMFFSCKISQQPTLGLYVSWHIIYIYNIYIYMAYYMAILFGVQVVLFRWFLDAWNSLALSKTARCVQRCLLSLNSKCVKVSTNKNTTRQLVFMLSYIYSWLIVEFGSFNIFHGTDDITDFVSVDSATSWDPAEIDQNHRPG